MSTRAKDTVQHILQQADIHINGSRPWDIQVHDERFYGRVLREGSLGLGESYMEGWWDAKALDQFSHKIFKADLGRKANLSLSQKWEAIKEYFFNPQTKKGVLKVAHEHYDLSNDLYMSFLDPYNQYTCGYFKNTKDLNKAQEQKLELICKKLHLTKKDRVLDIGCGWGGFAKYVASKYGCSVTGITISKEQQEFAKNFTKGLPVKIKLQDYRDIQGTFDKVLICGMIEHVGNRNYRTIMKKVYSLLNDSGLFLLHTIGSFDSQTKRDPWITKYIFANSEVPTTIELMKSIEYLFVMEDWHNFGAYYDPTLMAWFKNFDKNWAKFKNQYSEEFYRMFKYYLLMCAGGFRTPTCHLWQIVMSKHGVPGGYETFR